MWVKIGTRWISLENQATENSLNGQLEASQAPDAFLAACIL